MKGVIFTEFVEMLEIQHSPAFADDVLESTDLTSGGAYTAVGTYDVREITLLVRATAERLGKTESDVLRDYGRFLFGRLAVLYPQPWRATRMRSRSWTGCRGCTTARS